jgi:diguanylate cyclase (GGDEF)-like protein
MSIWPSRRRQSIGLRLFALAAVPLVMVGFLTSRVLLATQNRDHRANALQEAAEELVLLRHFRAVLNVDRAALQGAVIVFSEGLTFEQLREVLGIEMEYVTEQTKGLVYGALSSLLARQSDDADHDVRDYGELLEGREDLIDPNSGATVDDVSELFAQLQDVLAADEAESLARVNDLLASGLGSDAAVAELSRRLEAAQTFSALVSSIGSQASMLGLGISRPELLPPDFRIDLGAAVDAEESALHALRANPLSTRLTFLDSDETAAAEWEQIQSDILSQLGLTSGPPVQMDVIARARLSANIGLVSGQRLSSATATNEHFRDLIGEATDIIAAENAAQLERELLLAIGGAIATLLWTTVVTVSFVRPIRRLTKRAARLRDGQFDDAAIGPIGSREIASLATTFDQLGENLQLVSNQIESIGLGRTVDQTLGQQLPGPFGEHVRQSIQRATDLTDRLAHQARRDVLTDMANRAAVLERLAESIERCSRNHGSVALLFIDLDGFKAVNDAYGHAAGDEVLKVVGARISDIVRGGDLAARLGGDEFVVIVERSDNTDLVVGLGERIIGVIEQPIGVGSGEVRLSASIGVATSTMDSTPLSILGFADQATYEAKRAGKARVLCFDSDMQAASEQRADIERALRHGLSAGELELFVQPIVASTSGSVKAGEALIRWNRPGHGVVQPGAFIPIAEESWLIVEIGRFVLEDACRMISSWHVAGLDLALSVNIAGRHLADGDLVNDVSAALQRHGTPAHLLIVELTETQLVRDLNGGAAVLTQLRAIGVSIALDDFGTGYSSLNYLRQLPIDTMKIDRSYISELPGNAQSSSIVASLHQLAASLGLDVVAEGVETAEQAAFLADLGCAKLQGFHFARPMPSDQFEQWVSNNLAANVDG